MTTRERLHNLLLDNGIDPFGKAGAELISCEGNEYDASTEVILEMNSRINRLEKSVKYLSEVAYARR